jgi:hypothetical protein
MIQTDKITIEKFQSIIGDLENSGNKDITSALDFLKQDFEETKNMILDLTNHLDNIEALYNQVLIEYNKRNNG